MQSDVKAIGIGIRPVTGAIVLLPGLVGLADVLIWQTGLPRLSLAVFSVALGVAAHLLAGRTVGGRAALIGWGGLILGAVAVVEEVQFLSVLFLIAGLFHAAGWFVAGSRASWAVAFRASLRLSFHAMMRNLRDICRLGQKAQGAKIGRAGLARFGRDWALPLGLGGLFVLLFINANPVLDIWALRLGNWSPAFSLDLWRILFWVVMAGLIWPFLRLSVIGTGLLAPPKPKVGLQMPEAVLNPRSVLRALLVFNLIFALQTGLDLTYLWGGVSLPDGMSHATYAHRGAYPLVVTALLAGGFALLTQPFLQGQPVLRGLLFLWTAQNILLVISSILRLDLYVDAYGLTRLRFAAFIWMGLVVAGLALMVWQVWQDKPVGWLVRRAALLGLATLYLCCFINVAGVVARHNLARTDQAFDHYYLCNLGPGAAVAIAQASAATGIAYCDNWGNPFVKAPQNLREWGYRNFRLRNSLAAMTALTEVRTIP